MNANLLTLLGLVSLFAAAACAVASYLTDNTGLRIPALILMLVGLGLRLAARRR